MGPIKHIFGLNVAWQAHRELPILPLLCWPMTMQDGTQSPPRMETAHPPAKV